MSLKSFTVNVADTDLTFNHDGNTFAIDGSSGTLPQGNSVMEAVANTIETAIAVSADNDMLNGDVLGMLEEVYQIAQANNPVVVRTINHEYMA